MSSYHSRQPGRGGRGPGRGRGRGRDSASSTSPNKGKSRNQTSGRRLYDHELSSILTTFYHLSGDARQELLNRLTEMVGGRPPTAVPVLPGKPGQDGQPSSPLQAGPKKAKKIRPWDREILRDCPSVQRFKEFTSEERKGDRVTSRLISIVCGAISRGRHQGISVEDMAHAILPLAETDIQAVRVLWPHCFRCCGASAS
jgi:hypothetical protein